MMTLMIHAIAMAAMYTWHFALDSIVHKEAHHFEDHLSEGEVLRCISHRSRMDEMDKAINMIQVITDYDDDSGKIINYSTISWSFHNGLEYGIQLPSICKSSPWPQSIRDLIDTYLIHIRMPNFGKELEGRRWIWIIWRELQTGLSTLKQTIN